MEEKDAELKIKDLDKKIESKKQEVERMQTDPIRTGFGATSWIVYRFIVKHNISFLKALVWFFIGIFVWIILALVNNFYLKIFF